MHPLLWHVRRYQGSRDKSHPVPCVFMCGLSLLVNSVSCVYACVDSSMRVVAETGAHQGEVSSRESSVFV